MQGCIRLTERLQTIRRPARWDEPLDEHLTDQDVQKMLAFEPFASMDAAKFPKRVPLEGILANDCRILELERGDIIVREGDYGSSAFLILSGDAIVSLQSLPPALLGRVSKPDHSWTRAIAKLWGNSRHAEVRDYSVTGDSNEIGSRETDGGQQIFLHDIPRVIPPGKSVTLKEGEIFGELSALTRTPRSATVVAGSKTRVLEIRWQGFRDLMKSDPALRQHVDRLYRQNSLQAHLRETDILTGIPDDAISKVAAATELETFGRFQWSHDFGKVQKEDIAERILKEPLIAEQGQPLDGLILVRNGFARLSRQHGDGHQTIAYLGKGQAFGLRELAHNWKTNDNRPALLSLRAVGYVDVLKIPVEAVESLILPNVPLEQLPPELPRQNADGKTPGKSRRMAARKDSMDQGLLEFLVEQRFINGTQTMMIDLDRCTRCDDCVRACAATHDNNPRFIRHGKQHDNWMIANACMHCLDPVCMIGCPTGAISRDAESGSVTINDPTCIGCGTCSNSCPYSNIQMVTINDRKGLPIVDQKSGDPIQKATKCDLCASTNHGPACQSACPHDALVRIDMTLPDVVTDWTKR
jgi:Fe-S-cluster-containing dehydrogenase component/CRP-like cAMP-binding protein